MIDVSAHWLVNNTAYEVVYVPEQEILPPTVQLWRIPHDVERVNFDAKDYRYRPNIGMTGRGPVRAAVTVSGNPRPEVYRLQPDQTTPIDEAHQWLWRNINLELSPDKFCTLFGNTLAWTNNTGFPGHRNYILNKDMDKELPRFHAPLANGGQIVEGEEREGKVYIKSLLMSDPTPTADYVMSNHLWSYGTSVNTQGEINIIARLGRDGQYKNVRVLFMTKYPVWLPAVELHKLAPGEMPDARKIFV